jgi:hypothetical protein
VDERGGLSRADCQSSDVLLFARYGHGQGQERATY